MAYPNSGILKIYPSTVSIVSGQWALNSDGAPQPVRDVSSLQAFYDLRTGVLANAPCIRRATEFPPASGVYVPAVADYELQFFPSTVGVEFYNGAYPSPVIATHDFIDADFPIGMTINQVKLWWFGETLIGPNRNRTIDNMLFKYFGAFVDPLVPYVPGLYNGQISEDIISTPLITQWSFVQAARVFGIYIPVTSVVSANLGTVRSVISECFMTCNYSTQTFNFSLGTPNANPGDEITINDANGLMGELSKFKAYWKSNPDAVEMSGGVELPILSRNSTTVTLRLPTNKGLPYGGRRLIIFGVPVGFPFTGEINIAQVNATPLLTDGSGIYNLTPGKTNDTYYDRSVSPVETTDLKIPNPFIRTGSLK